MNKTQPTIKELAQRAHEVAYEGSSRELANISRRLARRLKCKPSEVSFVNGTAVALRRY